MKNSQNQGEGPAGCDVSRKAMWQRHADPRSAYVAHSLYIYLHYIIRGIQPPVYQEGIQPLTPSGLINPTYSTNVFRVGLKSHTLF